MAKRRGTIDASVEEYAAEKRRSEGVHPEVEELAAYHDGDLDDEAQERIREHLTFCEECSRLVVDLANFAELEPPSEDHRLSAEDVKTRRAALMARLRGEEKQSARLLEFTPPRPEPAKGEPRTSIPVWYHAVAAALLAATVGLSFWVLGLRQQVAGVGEGESAPKLNTVVRDLQPVDDVLRGTGSLEPVFASPESDLVLLLTFLKDISYDDYRVEIFDESNGRLLQALDGLELQSEGLFSLTFPRKLRSPGYRFRLKVLGLGAGAPEPLAEYLLSFGDGMGPSNP